MEWVWGKSAVGAGHNHPTSANSSTINIISIVVIDIIYIFINIVTTIITIIDIITSTTQPVLSLPPHDESQCRYLYCYHSHHRHFFNIKHNMGAAQTVRNKDEFHVYQLQKGFILHICSGSGPEKIQQCPNKQGSFRKGDIFHPWVQFVFY